MDRKTIRWLDKGSAFLPHFFFPNDGVGCVIAAGKRRKEEVEPSPVKHMVRQGESVEVCVNVYVLCVVCCVLGQYGIKKKQIPIKVGQSDNRMTSLWRRPVCGIYRAVELVAPMLPDCCPLIALLSTPKGAGAAKRVRE